MSASGSCAPGTLKCPDSTLNIFLLAWLREMIRAPLHSTLSVIGIALGVAALVAVNIANYSARESFLAASETMQESASHTISGVVSDDIFRRIRLETRFPAQPLVQGRVRIVGMDDLSAVILGIDPISHFEFSSNQQNSLSSSQDVGQLLNDAYSAYATKDTLSRLRIDVGDSIEIRHRREHYVLKITGLLNAPTPLEEQSMRLMLLTDIATAQTVLDMRGKLSSIQLQLPQSESAVRSVESLLPQGAMLEGRFNRQRSVISITEAFQTNLTAMSLLALLVAVFLIYNTMTFLVMRRVRNIEIFRALGVTRHRIIAGLILEAALLGTIASVIGFTLGAQLAKLLLNLVEQSINNLYFPINAEITLLNPQTIFTALTLGIGAPLIATVPALREAAGVLPSFGVPRRALSSSGRNHALLTLIACGIFVLAGIAIMQLSPTSIVFGFAGIYLIVAGYFCLVPILCRALGQAMRSVAKHLFGIRGILASRALSMSGGRTSVAICALCVAISATIGVGVMISSFRTAVDTWLGDRLRADIYVSTQGYGDELTDFEIESLQALSGVESVGIANWTWLQKPDGRARLFAVDYGEYAFAGYRFKSQVPEIWPRFQTEGVIVSEPYAFKHSIAIGDTLKALAHGDVVELPVLGVYYDYSSDRGVVSIHRDVYVSFFGDTRITTAALFAKPGADLQMLADAAALAVESGYANIWNAGALHKASMDIFDQTFTITTVLRVLAVVVAFIAVVSILAMIQIDRERELRIQNAIGFTTRQIWMSATAEAGVMGLFAGLLSLPVGLILTWLLIWVVNQRSFGWTMEMLIDIPVLTDAVLISVGAALLAALVPAWRLAKLAPVQLMRVE